MEQAPAPEGLPPSLRFLKGLVIVLTLTMIIGVITVVAVIVTRMPQSFAARPALPDLPSQISLPEGTKPQAVTFGKTWTAIVTEDDRILVFGEDGALMQEIMISPN
jgi:hypothetical protein